MEPAEIAWKEYDHLKEEIRHLDGQNYQVLAFVGASAFAILAAASKEALFQYRVWVAAGIYIMTYLGRSFIENNRRQIWRVSTYMRVFLEVPDDQAGAHWETRLHKRAKLLDSDDKKKATQDRELLASLFLVLSVADWVALGFIIDASWQRLHVDSHLTWYEWPVALLCLGVGIGKLWYDRGRKRAVSRNSKAEDEDFEIWRRIRTIEEEQRVDRDLGLLRPPGE